MATLETYKYKVIKTDNTSFDVHLSQVLSVGWNGTITVGDEKMSVYVPGEARILKEVSDKAPEINSDIKDNCLVALVSVVFLVLVISILVNIRANIGMSPDDAVLRAAQSVSPEAVVSKSHYSWQDGCDRSDTRRYNVFVNYQKVAIICQGNVYPAFGSGDEKAPVVRYIRGN